MDYIEIKGYKSIKDLHLELKPINVLIGANGAGKSNFISFFGFLNAAYDRLMLEYVSMRGGVNKFLHNGRKETKYLSAKLSFDKGNDYYAFILMPSDENFIVRQEELGYKGGNVLLPAGSNNLSVKDRPYPRAGGIKKYLNGLKVYHFHETGKDSPFNSDANVIDSYSLQSHGANLAAFLYNLQQNNLIVYNRIVKVIQSVAPYFLDFDLRPNGEYIRLAWRDRYSENRYGATDFSAGTIRFIALDTLFLQPTPPEVIIIDEPELGLHPFAINKLAGLVKSVAERGTQVILSTQSVELVNCFSPEDVIAVDNKGGSSVFNRLDSSELSKWLEDYTVGDLWRQNLLDKGFPNK